MRFHFEDIFLWVARQVSLTPVSGAILLANILSILSLEFGSQTAKLVLLLSLLQTGYLLWVVRRAPLYQFLLFFVFLFPFYMIPAIYFQMPITSWDKFAREDLMVKFLLVHNFFVTGLLLGWRNGLCLPVRDALRSIRVPWATFGIAAVVMLATISMKSVNIFTAENAYEAYTSNLANESGLPEYLLVVIFIGLILKKTRIENWCFYGSVFFFFWRLIVSGYRVQLLMGLMLLGIYFWEHRLKPKWVGPSFAVAFLVGSALGYLKDGGFADFVPYRLIFDDSRGFVLAHHTAVIYSSMAVLGVDGNRIMPALGPLSSAFGLLLNVLVPSSMIVHWFPEFNIGMFIQRFTDTSGGMYAPVVFFYIFSYPGALVAGFLLSRLYSSVIQPPFHRYRPLLGVFALFTMVTFPRWVSYDVGNFFFRLPLYATIIYAFLAALQKCKSKVGLI